ncbi:MAG TPA: nucleotidyltransferase domain-containing protein [Actinocrinis sp.]|jgi:hypothetical protein
MDQAATNRSATNRAITAPPGATAELGALIERAGRVAQEDARILAACLVGSFATGRADAFSDIDLHCVIEDDDVAWFRENWRTLAERMTDAVHTGQIPNVVGGLAITPQWQHLDLVFHPRSHFRQEDHPALWPLFDRTGELLPAEPRREPPGDTEPYFPAQAVDLYLYFLGNLAVVLGRGELLLASNGAILTRDVGLVQVMLAENGVRKSDGAKRLNRYLTDDQRAFLEALPPVASDQASVIAHNRLVAAEFIRRGRALAARTGAQWPAAFERATLDYLKRSLGVDFGPDGDDRDDDGDLAPSL